MATKTVPSKLPFEEITFQNDRVALCLLVNRRARAMRVIDFRSGFSPAKRIFAISLAQREGVERVYTLVEREESSAWARLGFKREGTIPGFYKRSDAHILGVLVPSVRQNDPEESGLRPMQLDYAKAVSQGPITKLYQSSRQLAKTLEGRPLPPVKVAPGRDEDVKKLMHTLLANGRGLSGFEPFSRDVQRRHFMCTARGGFSLVISVESQSCYSNAFIELLTAPRTEKETLLTIKAVGKMCETLTEEGVVGSFALSPVDDLNLNAALLVNGFKRTGLLARHMRRDGEPVDAFVWSRKLNQPEGPGVQNDD